MTYLPGSKLRMASLDNKAKITSGVTADVFNVVEQNSSICVNYRLYFEPFSKIQWRNPIGSEGTGSGKMLTLFRVLGLVTAPLYSAVTGTLNVWHIL